MSVGAVVFDIGNVLIEWQPERYYDRAIGEERRRAMFAEVDLHAMNDAVDRGGDFAGEVAACAARYPHWAEEIQLWHDDWGRIAGPAIPGSVTTLEALRRAGVPVLALSNFGLAPFEIGRRAWPFLDSFDKRYLSGALGMAKPDAEIYAALEATCGHAPEALLFVDDRQENIDAASARGWQTHLFTGPEDWGARLVAEGLLPPHWQAAP
ncbi:HAD family hydrolase [Litorisediminicola beolgyonensis]|uniref:HAD family hydrolase n=1 Tax=Litorisediminicola beolgyonensis TaxID=1173614 RepID=A0ABW3ZN36_9RHOB